MPDIVSTGFSQDQPVSFKDTYIYGKLQYNFDEDDINVKTIQAGNTTINGTTTTKDITVNGNETITGDISAGGNINAKQISIIGGSSGGFLKADGSVDTNSYMITPASGNVFTTGMIMMWSGASSAIPNGWKLCDGTDSTPDLRGRFIVGASAAGGGGYQVNATGGNESITLSTANLPAHTHDDGTLSTNTTGSHTHSYTRSSGSSTFDNDEDHAARANSDTSSTTGSNGDHSHTISGNTGSTGSGSTIDIRPKYYALCYIMKT